MPSLRFFAAAATAAFAASTASAATTVDFSDVPTGYHANATVIGGVAFHNTGANATFHVDDHGGSSIGQGLEAYDPGTPGGGGVFMKFAAPQSAMSLLFGNDDPGYTLPGALAVLVLSLGVDVVETVTVTMNRDDLANQTIGFSGAAFDSALFFMADAAGNPLSRHSEVIDNVTYSNVAAPVPEPSTLALTSLGLAGVGAIARRRRSS